MSEASTKVEIVFTTRDNSAPGTKAVEQTVAKSAANTEKILAQSAVNAGKKTVAAAQSSATESISAYAKMANAREQLGIKSENTIRREIAQTEAAYNRLARSGVASARELARAQDAAAEKTRKLRQEMGEVSKMERVKQVGQAAAAVGAGVAVANAVIDKPVRSYENLEAAQADLKIALMAKGGKVSAAYDEINRQAVDLGNKLPGATKDFVAAASALKEQGMTESAITGGGLKASAYFGVLANMDQYQSATTVAKMREAYNLRDDELPEMANQMQKGRYAFGIHPDDFRAVAQYAAPTYNTLGLKGAEHAKELMAVQGISAGVGLENSSFGTNFAMMLQRTSQIDSRLGGKGKEAAEAREALAEHNIKMSFYGKDGKFLGIEHMLGELDKLKPLKDIDRMHVLNKLFGVEASRPASILIDKGGVKAFHEAMGKLDEQPDMEDRLSMKTSTLRSKKEALSGTWENIEASAGKEFGEWKKKKLDSVNDFLGDKVQPLVDKNPGLGTGAIALGAAGSGIATIYSAAKALQYVTGTSTGTRLLSAVPGIQTVAGLASRVPVVPKGAGLFGLAAGVGGAVLSSVAGEESATARYGSAALSGAGLGATVGSLIPVIGTGIGAAVGGIGGLIVQAISEATKSNEAKTTEAKPVEMNAKFTVGLAPGLVLQGQSFQATGANVSLNTGNIMTGAPN